MSYKGRRSQFWLHFTDIDSENTVECLLCGQKLSIKNNSTCSLIRHMNKKHPSVPIEKKHIHRRPESIVNQYVDLEDSSPSQVWVTEVGDESHEENEKNPLRDPSHFKVKKQWSEIDYEVIEEDEYSIFTKLIVTKLRKLSNKNKLIAQRRITNILFELEMEENEQTEKTCNQ